jgi:hypothetical protein
MWDIVFWKKEEKTDCNTIVTARARALFVTKDHQKPLFQLLRAIQLQPQEITS